MPALTLTHLAALLLLEMGTLLLTLALMLRLRLPVTEMLLLTLMLMLRLRLLAMGVRLLMHRLPVIRVFVFPVAMIRIRLTPMIALPVGG
jgi:hypothetical protein